MTSFKNLKLLSSLCTHSAGPLPPFLWLFRKLPYHDKLKPLVPSLIILIMCVRSACCVSLGDIIVFVLIRTGVCLFTLHHRACFDPYRCGCLWGPAVRFGAMASPGGQAGAGALSTRGGGGVRRMKWALELSLGGTRWVDRTMEHPQATACVMTL